MCGQRSVGTPAWRCTHFRDASLLLCSEALTFPLDGSLWGEAIVDRPWWPPAVVSM